MPSEEQKYQRSFDDKNTLDDLILLENPTNESITKHLENRFDKNWIYTYIGNTIVSVNPYTESTVKHMYSNAVKHIYHSHQPYELAPHLYSLAEAAYRNMRENGTSQSIIVSGESGAGKTVAAKLILEYIAAVSVSGLVTENIKRIIVESNPVLEAFGNAKTLKNHNSSRFGKYIDIFFNFKGQMEGGHITTSLLEKSRVCNQRPGERSFHIFYQLCAGADDLLKFQLNITSPKHYYYLNRSDTVIKGVSDKAEFKKTCASMTEAGISVNEQVEIFRVLAGILHLGNIKFTENRVNNQEGSQIKTVDALKKAATALQVDEEKLAQAMLFRKIKTGGEITQVAQNPERAAFNRDALAKSIYERLFLWLVRRINASVKKPDDAKYSIGILDIYGFEIFEDKQHGNGLDQLNINYVNEKIQQQIQKWLQREQEEYVAEGVPWNMMKLFNCDGCVNVIEGKPMGVYALLDEESLLGKGTDENYVAKLTKAFEKNEYYEKNKFDKCMFSLNHYAAKVNYNTKGWVETNKDTVYEDLIKAMQTSSSDLMKSLFPKNEKIEDAGRLQRTIGKQFQEDVFRLVGKLSGKKHHYVRCIKPNHEKKPMEFEKDVVLDQVRYLGLCENVFVRKCGYYFKMPYDKFLNRYKLCCDKTWPRWNGTPKEGVAEILKAMDLMDKSFLGKTKVFIQSPFHLFALDEKIASRRAEMATLIQKAYRRYRQRKIATEKEQLTKALGRTFGEKPPFQFVQTMNLINASGKRKKILLVLTPTALYMLDPKSYAIMRRIKYEKMDSIVCSALPDGVFAIKCPKEYDVIFEADSKHPVIKAIRDAFEQAVKTQLKVDIGEDFPWCPRRGLTKALKFRKNPEMRTTHIEYTSEGIIVSIRPSDDVFAGKKLRRKESFHKKFYGDYLHLQNSLVMQQQRELHGDQNVHFSAVVVKYNKKFKKQERILMITERAVYNLDPNGYMVNRRIPLRRLKGCTVSPLTDGFFVLNIPDEYDYVFESSKKTEILKILADNYTGATRSTLKFDVKQEIQFKPKNSEPKLMKFKEDPTVAETILEPTKYGALIRVKPESVMSNDMSLEVIQDIYQGQKLRRRESLIRWYMGDYLHFSNHKIMQKLMKKYGATKLLYSGIVAKVNRRYAVQNRKMIITDEAIYNIDTDSDQINRRIPLLGIDGIAVSQMRDGFFVLRVPEEYDYLHVSANKTEIIKCIMDQYKKLTGKTLPLHVDNKLVYSPYHKSKGKGVRTIEFKEDLKVKIPTILLTKTGIMIKVNNTDEVTTEANHQEVGIADKLDSIYGGRKYRRKTSIGRQYIGDYLRLEQSPVVKQLLKMNGDKTLLFSANVMKINKKFKTQNRILLITDKAMYNIDPNQFRVQRRIKLEDIDGVSVSSLTDGHFALHIPGGYDYLYASDKKTEIIDTLNSAMEKMSKRLKVNVGDRFEYCPNGKDIESVSFVLDDNSDETFLEHTNNGLIVHVSHDEPSVVLEAAFVHVKDQPKPIEVKAQPILIKLRKKWKYKLEIRFYVNDHIEGCSFHEKIDTVSSRQEFVSQVGTLVPRDERYVITLPERTVLFSVLSKTRVKAKLVDPNNKVLLAVRFVYDVR